MLIPSEGAVFAQGVLDALGKRPFALQRGTGVRDGMLYANGYLYVSQDDLDALGYEELVWEDTHEYYEMLEEQRNGWRT